MIRLTHFTLGGLLVSSWILGPNTITAKATPNILFIFSDDHTWQTISAYGNPLGKIVPTPNIDRIGDEGMRFEKCYVTNSICAPSRAVVLTGKYSHLNGQIHNWVEFDGSQETVPKMLQKAGYETAIIGKWHLRSQPTGFDHHEVMPGQGRYYDPVLITDEKEVVHKGYNTDVVTKRSIHWMENRDSDKPFVLMCQFKATHGPFQPALRHLGELDNIMIPEPPNFFDDFSGRSSSPAKHKTSIAVHMPKRNLSLEYRGDSKTPEAYKSHFYPQNKVFDKAKLSGEELAKWRYQRFIKNFLLTSKAIDENVGRLLDFLDKNNMAENTIVVYASDQGFMLGEHGWYDKRWMYEECLKTSFLVRWPGVTAPGAVNQDIVSNLDFAPMLLDMAGANIPSDMQGHSLVPILKGETPSDWRNTFYYRYHGEHERDHPFRPGNYWNHGVPPHDGVTTGRYKLIHYKYDEVNEWEFFDLKMDPGEMNSEYSNPKYANSIIRLKDELRKLRIKFQVTKQTPLSSHN